MDENDGLAPPDLEPDRPEDPAEEPGFIHWPREPRLDDAKKALAEIFDERSTEVFYGRQLEVWMEDDFFHWITHKALREMSREDSVQTELRETATGNKLRLYWSVKNRYWKRAAKEILRLVDEHSDPEWTKALGQHAEMLFGVALAGQGFEIAGRNTRTYGVKTWRTTEHDLDWIVEKDGKAYGVEIKNTWAYIGREDLYLKMELCHELGLALFSTRHNCSLMEAGSVWRRRDG